MVNLSGVLGNDTVQFLRASRPQCRNHFLTQRSAKDLSPANDVHDRALREAIPPTNHVLDGHLRPVHNRPLLSPDCSDQRLAFIKTYAFMRMQTVAVTSREIPFQLNTRPRGVVKGAGQHPETRLSDRPVRRQSLTDAAIRSLTPIRSGADGMPCCTNFQTRADSLTGFHPRYRLLIDAPEHTGSPVALTRRCRHASSWLVPRSASCRTTPFKNEYPRKLNGLATRHPSSFSSADPRS